MQSFQHPDIFESRHIGPSKEDIEEMCSVCGVSSVDELIDETVPSNIRLKNKLKLADPLSEYEFINLIQLIASKNKVYKSYIGMGYNPTILPSVIQRNILENPGWYTQYTPYQAEIAQGRLEALLNFQTVVSDLTSLPIANASLLDEATSAAEAMVMFFNNRKKEKGNAKKFFVSDEVFPQTIDVLKTRSKPLGIELLIDNHKTIELTDEFFGLLVQYPAMNGEIYNYTKLFSKADELKIYKVVAADLLSLTLLVPPGEFGADCAVGTTQRFGIPMGFGGPHAAYFATKEEFKRVIPGRIIGVSVDSQGNRALRMALQTREQHIKRERATSNICTAQVLLAVMAGMYAVYHGPENLKAISLRINSLTNVLSKSLVDLGLVQINKNYFDTITFLVDESIKQKIKNESLKRKLNLNFFTKGRFSISLSETTTLTDVDELIETIASAIGKEYKKSESDFNNDSKVSFDYEFERTSKYLEHDIFNSYKSETDILRYMKYLENKDLSLVHSMIPLGSCTMKLNATTEMLGVTLPQFSNIHPFTPEEQLTGYLEMFREFENQLAEITGFDSVSLQPNSGAQGEYAGLSVIKAYLEDKGELHRNIALIPSSAHGTNPASAVMAGMKVVVVNCDDKGNIDVNDLKTKAELHKNNLAALLVTYPSTHGVFEESIKEICEIIHQNGGQVYMDGANMNAQVGLTSPAEIGADVCHLNLHKTFCIPHGGGGPGVGPIAVAKHLSAFLPGHSIVNINKGKSINAVSAAQFGSASVIVISYAYIKMMGEAGLSNATKMAILNANYIKAKLEPHYKVLYSGSKGKVAHELIFDMREFKQSAHIVEVEDIAKRLMDYGYHAPTVSFPVAGTLMIEPTESEPKSEMDKFCEALISIREEIREIENGTDDVKNNVLKNSPHTAQMVISDSWNYPYLREKAAYPISYLRTNKFWPAVSRVDNAYGDRNLVCSCLPVSEYAEN